MSGKSLIQSSVEIAIGVIGLSLATQSQSIAQVPQQEVVSLFQQVAVAGSLEPMFTIPELPPLEPTLPEVEEIRLVLRLQKRRVYLYRGNAVLKSYPVAIGRPGWETPKGSFKVIQMLKNPGWTNPFTGEVVPAGQQNPLGERWIGFWTNGENLIGFHGTPNRESVGRAASHGCVRMYNEHIRDLYNVVSLGTPVTVEP